MTKPAQRVLICTRQPLLGRLLAESLGNRGYATMMEPNLAAVPHADETLHPSAIVLDASGEALEWLRTQDASLRHRCLVLGEGDLSEFTALGCRAISPADSVDRVEQEVRELSPKGNAPRPLLLIVDDDPETRATVRDYFQAVGYDCASADNGMEALNRIRQELPDVVLLDLNMPEMGGLDFLKVVRQLNNAFGIIVITAMRDPKLAARAVSAGAFDVVEKPINFQHLAYLVRIQLNYRQLRERLRLKTT